MNRIIKRYISLIFLLLISLSVNPQDKKSSDPYFIIQITDPQFGMYDSNKSFAKETELYRKAVIAVNRLNPDFVVITGDLLNNKDDASQKAEFRRITAEIKPGIPVYYTPGNHDIGQAPGQKDIDSFVADYGHDRFSFNHKNSLFIGLNSCIIKSDTSVLEQQQFNWLNNELSKAGRQQHIVVFCHYPFFINTPGEPETYSNIPVETRNRYLSLFYEKNVNVIYAGHLHNNASGKYGNMDMITTNAVGKPLGSVESGVRVIEIYPDRILSVFYTLNKIPEKIF